MTEGPRALLEAAWAESLGDASGSVPDAIAATPSGARLLALAADAQRLAEEAERLRKHLDAASRRAHQCGHGTGSWATCDAPSCVMDRAALAAPSPEPAPEALRTLVESPLMDDATLAAIRERAARQTFHRGEWGSLPMETTDAIVTAVRDRRALLAEVDRLRAVIADLDPDGDGR